MERTLCVVAIWPWSDLADLQDPSTSMQWDVPSPYVGDTSKMVVNTNNLGGNGDVTFALQNLLMVAFGQRLLRSNFRQLLATRSPPPCL